MNKIDIELEIEYIPVNQLTPYEKNTRKHGEYDVGVIMESIEKYGFSDAIGIWGKDNIIVEGHGRLLAAKKLGMKTVPCVRLDHLTDEERREYAIMHNKSAELSEWDFDILGKELAELDMSDFNIDWGILEEGEEKEIIEDEVPEVDEEAEPICKLGDIWQLGEHRLICGDSTDKGTVERLMNGEKADMVFTDPPYGVSYTEKNEFLNRIWGSNRLTNPIENDSKEPTEMYSFWVKAFKILFDNTKEKMSYYITAPQGVDLLLLLLQAVRDSGFALKHQLIWNKNNHVLGRCDYNYKHEPIIFGWKINKTHNFYSKGKFLTSVWDIPKPQHNDLHPTMKPIELIANALQNSAKEGDIILDLFGGSGSTLIACEQLNRKCYMCELSEHYCDVIIQRWENFTNKKAVKIL